jgi:hypothetical protein
MSWSRIALYYVLFAVAVAWYYRATSETARLADAPEVQTLLDVAVDSLAHVDLIDGERRVRFRSEGGRWKVVYPEAHAPGDLLKSFVVTLIETQPAEVVADDRRLEADYGVGAEALRIDLYERGHERPIRVFLGNRNPTETAVYARVEGRPEILLVGRVLQYYAERIFEETGGKPEARPPPTIDADPVERTTGYLREPGPGAIDRTSSGVLGTGRMRRPV